MKKRNYIKITFMFITVMVFLSSCLKDKRYVDYSKSPTVVEFPAVAGTGLIVTQSFAVATTPTLLTVNINAAQAQPLASDLTVTIMLNADSLAKYNAANGTDYEVLPAADYSINSLKVVIPAGQRSANLQVNLKTNLIDPAGNYILPFTIADASGQKINGQLNTVFYSIKVKSIYDGDYSATGSISFPDPSTNRTWTNRDKELTTVSANTVEAEVGDLAGNGYYMDLTVNTNNTVTITPAESSPASLQATGACTYDPASKTFTLNYKYVGGTGDRLISETIKHN